MIQSNLKLILPAASNRVQKVILQEHYVCADYKAKDQRPLSSGRVFLEHVNLLVDQRSAVMRVFLRSSSNLRTLERLAVSSSASNQTSWLAGRIISPGPLIAGMNSSELEQLIKGFLEAKFGTDLDYFVIEGRMAPDANGNIGVTGTYRKRTGDKNIFFTVTINLTSRKIQNLQEY